MLRALNGKDLINIVGSAHYDDFEHDAVESDQEAEIVGGLLQNLTDYGDIWDSLDAIGRVNASLHKDKDLKRLEGFGFWAFGAIESRQDEMEYAVVRLLRQTNPLIHEVKPDGTKDTKPEA